MFDKSEPKKRNVREIVDEFGLALRKMADDLTASDASLETIAAELGTRYPYLNERVVTCVAGRRNFAEGKKNGTAQGDSSQSGPFALVNDGRVVNQAMPGGWINDHMLGH